MWGCSRNHSVATFCDGREQTHRCFYLLAYRQRCGIYSLGFHWFFDPFWGRLSDCPALIFQMLKKSLHRIAYPCNGHVFGALPLLVKHTAFSFLNPVVITNPGLILLTVLFVILMNTDFDLFSFKSFKTGMVDLILRVLLILSAPFFIYFLVGGNLFICFGLFVF